MTTYQKLVSAFQKVGLFEDSLTSEREMKQALDKMANQNARMHEFDDEVAKELWEETPRQGGNNVYVRDFINTVVKGEQILRNEIDNTESTSQVIQNKFSAPAMKARRWRKSMTSTPTPMIIATSHSPSASAVVERAFMSIIHACRHHAEAGSPIHQLSSLRLLAKQEARQPI